MIPARNFGILAGEQDAVETRKQRPLGACLGIA